MDAETVDSLVKVGMGAGGGMGVMWLWLKSLKAEIERLHAAYIAKEELCKKERYHWEKKYDDLMAQQTKLLDTLMENQ